MRYILLIVPLLLVIHPAFADVFIQNDQQYISDDGSLHIVGEVENNSNVPLNQIKITANLLDKNGYQVNQVNGKPINNVIMPGMTGAFDIIVTDPNSYIIDDYDLELDYKIAEPKNQVIEIVSSELKKNNQGNFVI